MVQRPHGEKSQVCWEKPFNRENLWLKGRALVWVAWARFGNGSGDPWARERGLNFIPSMWWFKNNGNLFWERNKPLSLAKWARRETESGGAFAQVRPLVLSQVDPGRWKAKQAIGRPGWSASQQKMRRDEMPQVKGRVNHSFYSLEE